MDDVEQVAGAIKADMGEQFDAKSLPHGGPGDWSATGDTLDLGKTAQAAITAYKAWLKDNGWVIVRREPTDKMMNDVPDEVEDADWVWATMLKEGEMPESPRTGSSPPYTIAPRTS